MSDKRRPVAGGSSRRAQQESVAPRRADAAPAPTAIAGLADGRVRFGLIILALLLAAIVVMGSDYAFSTIFGNGAAAAPSATAALQKNR
ncbi:MAG TPA: hypothetical protein VF375_00840 [Candidatus Limnocylindrales bacterium]